MGFHVSLGECRGLRAWFGLAAGFPFESTLLRPYDIDSSHIRTLNPGFKELYRDYRVYIRVTLG